MTETGEKSPIIEGEEPGRPHPLFNRLTDRPTRMLAPRAVETGRHE